MTAELLTFLDPTALALVVGGSLLVAILRATRAEIIGALRALWPLVRADPAADAQAAGASVARIAAIADARTIACVDRVATAGPFLKEAAARLADARSSQAYARWAEEALARRAARHAGIAGFWRSVADTAPAMGMIATVIGLIAMFRAMDDPARIGPPMATALVATLVGLVLANLVAGPIAERLERLSEAELAWQRRAVERFTMLARAELDQAHGLQQTLTRTFR